MFLKTLPSALKITGAPATGVIAMRSVPEPSKSPIEAAFAPSWTKSIDCPKYGLLCIPDRKPSTTLRASISSREIRAIASGGR